MSYYPGDEYVDILAFDYYNDYNSYPASADNSFFDSLDTTCNIVSSIAAKRGKIPAIAECGVRVMKKDGSDNEGLLVKGNPVGTEASGKNWYQEVSDIAKKNNMHTTWYGRTSETVISMYHISTMLHMDRSLSTTS